MEKTTWRSRWRIHDECLTLPYFLGLLAIRTERSLPPLPPAERSLRDKLCSGIIEYGILGLLVFSPLPAASVHEWSILLIELTTLLLVAAYVLMKHKPPVNQSLSRSLRGPKILFIGFFLFLVVQIIPLPASLVRILSPASHRFRALYASGPGEPGFMSFSIVPSYTFQEALELLSYFLIGLLVLRTITHRRQILRLVSVLLGMGVFQAFYGLFELSSKSPRLLFYKKIYGLEDVTGTFVNRNHLSGYLEMVIALALGLIISRIGVFSFSRLSRREKLLRLSEKGLSMNILFGLGVVLMAMAIIFSHSRSGTVVLVLEFLLFLGLVGLFSEFSSDYRKRIRTFLRALFFLIIILSVGLGIDATLKRFALDDLLEERRPMYWAHAVRMFRQYPLLGTGLGTFNALAPPFEGPAGPVSIGHAHNDYLEYASELGASGFALLFGGILSLTIISWRVWRTRRHPEVKGLALGGIVSLTGILLHSLTDFNLHIPANMLLFSVVLSVTLVTVFYRKETAAQERR